MVKVLDEGADLSEHTLLKCTADGALFDSHLVELTRKRNGETRGGGSYSAQTCGPS